MNPPPDDGVDIVRAGYDKAAESYSARRDRFHSERYLKRFAGGVLLITMGVGDYEGTEQDLHGAEMYWSHFNAAQNRTMVEAAGFTVKLDEIDESSNERHQIILATRDH